EADRGVEGLRVAWSPDLSFAPVEKEVASLTAVAARAFEELGCLVEDVALELDDPWEIAEVLIGAGAAGGHRDTYQQIREVLDPDRVPVLERAFGFTAADVGPAPGRDGQGG